MSSKSLFNLNGYTYLSTAEITLRDLANYFNCNNSLLVIEYNNLINTISSWEKTIIANHGKVEFVTIVGGG